MALNEHLDDDYVARLLAEDAKRTSKRYASHGLSAFLPNSRASNVPKPNTRFLRHIVREADQHNAALKRKEELESEQRLRALQAKDEHRRKRRRTEESADSKRSRLSRDIADAARSERPTKRRRSASRDVSESHHVRLPPSERYEKDADKDSRTSYERRKKQRAFSPSEGRPSRSESLSYTVQDKEESIARDSRRNILRKKRRPSTSTDSTDPLEEVLAPHSQRDEKIRVRGRGAHKQGSTIDAHFAADYDPTHDVSLSSDHEVNGDWDMALEALRDRTKWKQNQTARLQDAGFDKHEIAKREETLLNDSRRLPDEKDVRWLRKGEVREWDAGKVLE